MQDSVVSRAVLQPKLLGIFVRIDSSNLALGQHATRRHKQSVEIVDS